MKKILFVHICGDSVWWQNCPRRISYMIYMWYSKKGRKIGTFSPFPMPAPPKSFESPHHQTYEFSTGDTEGMAPEKKLLQNAKGATLLPETWKFLKVWLLIEYYVTMRFSVLLSAAITSCWNRSTQISNRKQLASKPFLLFDCWNKFECTYIHTNIHTLPRPPFVAS